MSQPPKMSITQEYSRRPDGWDQLWKEQKIGWDKGISSPALVDLLGCDGSIIPKDGRVLVPGCGGGHDVFLFASRGNQAVGLDISPNAIVYANQLLSSQEVSVPSKVSFISASFFDFPLENGLFDCVYDYTFFCAIDPTLRDQWGSRIKDIIRIGGLLITLIFPIGTHTDGPPYAVQVEHYERVLIPGFEITMIKDVEKSHPGREGQEKIAVWKRV